MTVPTPSSAAARPAPVVRSPTTVSSGPGRRLSTRTAVPAARARRTTARPSVPVPPVITRRCYRYAVRMNPTEVLEKARDVLTARGTVGDPIHHDGVVVVPVAKVLSGGGGGMGQDTAEKEGRGGGFGITSTPVGAFVIKDGAVSWRPAVD